MSMRRVTALGASFVCSVLNTKCPVRGCLDAHLCCLKITHFSNQNNVRRLTQASRE